MSSNRVNVGGDETRRDEGDASSRPSDVDEARVTLALPPLLLLLPLSDTNLHCHAQLTLTSCPCLVLRSQGRERGSGQARSPRGGRSAWQERGPSRTRVCVLLAKPTTPPATSTGGGCPAGSFQHDLPRSSEKAGAGLKTGRAQVLTSSLITYLTALASAASHHPNSLAMSAHSCPASSSFFGTAPPPGFDPASLLSGLAQSDLPSFIHDVLANLAAAASSASSQAAAQSNTVISPAGPSSSSSSSAAASKAAPDVSTEASSSSSPRRPRCVASKSASLHLST